MQLGMDARGIAVAVRMGLFSSLPSAVEREIGGLRSPGTPLLVPPAHTQHPQKPGLRRGVRWGLWVEGVITGSPLPGRQWQRKGPGQPPRR